MAVLVEGISVVVRKDAIESKYTGGLEGFMNIVPNTTFCMDEELVRVGFMAPSEVSEFMGALNAGDLTFVRDGEAVDIAVVDQQRGPTTKVGWLEHGRLPINDRGETVAACWLLVGPRDKGYGTYVPSKDMVFAVPRGWQYEDSLSQKFTFIETVDVTGDAGD